MTNSMIPNSFIPGTKAKASEVNENFIALANAIEANKNLSASDIETLNQAILDITEQQDTINGQKADKTDLNIEFAVTETGTNLNNYTTPGSYYFGDGFVPENRPEAANGSVIVRGSIDSCLFQIWISAYENPCIFTRSFSNGSWKAWRTVFGFTSKNNCGYHYFPNGLIIQWGALRNENVTYPIAFKVLACPVATKNGCAPHYERSDWGLVTQTLTGFTVGSAGLFLNMNWIAIGY